MTDDIKCPVCNDSHITTRWITEIFKYGEEENDPELSVRIPLRSCEYCNFEYTDYVAEMAHEEAVNLHLKNNKGSE